MTDNIENNETSSPQLECVQRFSKLPVVELIWNHTTGMYEKVKGSNSVVNWTLSSAEATMQRAMQHAAPVAKKFEQPIHKMDETLCKGLNTLEGKVPIVKESPEQVLAAAQTYVNTTMQPAMEKVEVVKKFGTACGNYAKISLDATVEMADQYVEYYLPEEITGPTEEGTNITKQDQTIPQKVGKITVRVGRGVYRTIVHQMKSLGTKSERSITSLTHLSEMLHMTGVTVDSAAIAARASMLWSQLRMDDDFDEDSGDDDKGEKAPPGSVATAAVVARKLIRNVLNLCTQAAKALPTPPEPLSSQALALPSQLSSRLEVAAEYAKGLYVQLKLYNFQEASDSIKINMKEQISKIQAVLKDLNSYASQWMETNQPAENGAMSTSATSTTKAVPEK